MASQPTPPPETFFLNPRLHLKEHTHWKTRRHLFFVCSPVLLTFEVLLDTRSLPASFPQVSETIILDTHCNAHSYILLSKQTVRHSQATRNVRSERLNNVN